jgi:predicted O-methyltransferase YrrM
MKAFNGDRYILEEFKSLIKKFGIKYIIETGTYLGDTTEELAKIVGHVHTVEINPSYQKDAKEKLKGFNNIYFFLGSSPEILDKVLLPDCNPATMIFLDAHWNDYCPLIDELKMIAKHKLRPVIAIHDFKVPGKPYGYDRYNGQDYDFEWIEASLEEIYGKDGYSYYYNEMVEGSCRGIIYILPKAPAEKTKKRNEGRN